MWEELESETTPPVNLLVGVTEGCGLSEGVRSDVVQWCLKKGVELVEWNLNPPQNSQGKNSEKVVNFLQIIIRRGGRFSRVSGCG